MAVIKNNSEVIKTVADYIEDLPEGYETKTFAVLKQLFGDDAYNYDSFNLHFEVFDEIKRRGNVFLDMSEHEEMEEGLPQYLSFIVKKVMA